MVENIFLLATEENSLKHISPEAFKNMGREGIFYVRPVYIDGNIMHGLFNAAGEQLNLFPDEKTAHSAAWHNDLPTVSIH